MHCIGQTTRRFIAVSQVDTACGRADSAAWKSLLTSDYLSLLKHVDDTLKLPTSSVVYALQVLRSQGMPVDFSASCLQCNSPVQGTLLAVQYCRVGWGMGTGVTSPADWVWGSVVSSPVGGS